MEPRILQRAEHSISRQNISRNALKVLYRLDRGGYKAYLVGGSVRDLLLGRQPKDYDAGTNARPPQIRNLFRNSRIIGRRFRLVHVFFEDGVVEVATFRRQPEVDDQDSGGDELLITSDNTFGTPLEDAFRRDFTINALFYDIADFSVIDYVGGIEDLEHKLVRAIGDPDVRFQEDPVRMTRACEFAARLGFGIEQHTQEAILRQGAELLKASPARMTEELVQLLRSGHAGGAFQWMLDLGLVDVILPELKDMVEGPRLGLGDLSGILRVIDRLMGEGQEVSDSVLVAAVLLPRVWRRRAEREARRGRPLRRIEVEEIVQATIEPFLERFALSNAKAIAASRALVLFQRMCEPVWSPAGRLALAERRAFTDALALFELMVLATGEGDEELGFWRQALAGRSAAPPPEPEAAEVPAIRRRRRRRRSRGRRHSQAEVESV